MALPEQYRYYLRNPESEMRFAAQGAAKAGKPAPQVAAAPQDRCGYIGGEGGWRLVAQVRVERQSRGDARTVSGPSARPPNEITAM